MEQEELNFFRVQMTEEEQLELSTELDRFLQMYENDFENQGADEEVSDALKHELKNLYDLVWTLEDRAEKEVYERLYGARAERRGEGAPDGRCER